MAETLGLPAAILFACTRNTVRSPMAAAIMRHLFGHQVYVESCGLKPGEPDPFAASVMAEIGLDISEHAAKRFEDLQDGSFDLIISLSPEAHHRAMELTRTLSVDVEYWPMMDPTVAQGNRDQRLDAYRALRDSLLAKIRARFGVMQTPAP